MGRKIWIFNHYIIPPSIETGHRHNKFAKYLVKDGYDVSLFLSSMIHNSDINLIKDNKKYIIEESDQGRYIALKTRDYKNNGKDRILNILDYFLKLFSVTREIDKKYGVPDIIYASSVHPLTCVAGIIIAKRYKVKCIVEIRDLWPLTLVELGKIKENNLITRFLYRLEHWIYKKADSIIFTMEGGKNYIYDMNWSINKGGDIDENKIYHINNGVDLEFYDKLKLISCNDLDLDRNDVFKIVYTGSIRPANDIFLIVKVAEKLMETEYKDKFLFFIFGDGTDKEKLELYCKEHSLTNIVFKGKVSKELIPNILSKSNLNILNYEKNVLKILKYGGSQNKLFEYLAAGKPIISNVNMNYNLIERFKCGKSLNDFGIEKMASLLIKFLNLTDTQYNEYCKNARLVAEEYDFKKLTKKLEQIIENTIDNSYQKLG